jgi:hypothetical protein
MRNILTLPQYQKHSSVLASVTNTDHHLPTEGATWEEWGVAVEAQASQAMEQVKAAARTIQKKRIQTAQDRFNTLFRSNRRVAHRRIFSDGMVSRPTCMKHPSTGATHRTEKGILSCFVAHLAPQLRLPEQAQTGGWQSRAQPRIVWPWDTPGAVDRFVLSTPASAQAAYVSLIENVRDHGFYRVAVKSLANGKQAGPWSRE